MYPTKRVVGRVLWMCLVFFGAVGAASGQPILYVDDSAPSGGDGLSWATAYTDLQAALTAVASSGGVVTEVRVAAGTYVPSVPAGLYSTFAMIDGVAIRGGYAGVGMPNPDLRDFSAYPTILSGDKSGNDSALPATGAPPATWNDNCYHVVTASNTATAEIDGFVITHGYARTYNNPDRFGGGILRDYPAGSGASGATIRNCVVQDNYAEFGGGMFCDAGATSLIINCTFIHNNGGQQAGGMYTGGVAATIQNCTFAGNDAPEGGGMYVRGEGTRITNSVFSGNVAVGGNNRGGGLMTVAVGYAFFMSSCSFSGNTAGQGGAIYNGYGGPTNYPYYDNCVVWGNTATVEGSEVYNYDNGRCISVFKSSLIAGCLPGGVWSSAFGSNGGGNKDANPLFVDADGADNVAGTVDDDLRLLSGSPAVDAGNNALVPTGVTTDHDNGLRFTDDIYTPDTGVGPAPIVDMGAYELVDGDGDRVPDIIDNCPTVPNPGQQNADGDSKGDACDACPNDANKIAPGICGCGVADIDSDGDGVADCIDNCPAAANTNQANADGDAMGDACDPDNDNDGLTDVAELALAAGGGCPDPFDPDSDGDSLLDGDELTSGTDPCNARPTAVAAVEQLTDIGEMAQIRLDGSGSTDADDAVSTLTFLWTVDATVVCEGLAATCETITTVLPYGSHLVTLRVTDPVGGFHENTKTISLDPASLSVLEIEKASVSFPHHRPRTVEINGEIGLPFGVNYSELAPTATAQIAVAGVVVVPDSTYVFAAQGRDGSKWRYHDSEAVVTHFDIDWDGARFAYGNHCFPITFRSELISSSETVINIEYVRRQLGGPVTIDFDGLAVVSIDNHGVATATVPFEVDHAGRDVTVTLPFPITETSVITISGAQNRTIHVANYLKASVGRYRITVKFPVTVLPNGVHTTPRTLDLSATIGQEGYPGAASLDAHDFRVRGDTWMSEHGHCH
jgi:hypothetical protein